MRTVNPSWSWLLTRWDLEPSVVVGLLALTIGYLYVCGFRLKAPWARSQSSIRLVCSRAQLSLFLGSMAAMALALLSPLDYIGDDYLFSAHMVQHLVLASLFPPLFLMSLPEKVVATVFVGGGIRHLWRWLTFPALAFLIFNIDITVWHIPAFYDVTLRNEYVHIAEHLTFIVAGVIVWWPVLSPIRAQRLTFALQVLYLFANLFPMMALGIFFSFWQHPLYTPYVDAPRLWGISPLADQQLGGLTMWMPGDAPFVFAMLAILVRWFDQGDPLEQKHLWQSATEGPAT